MEEPLPGFFHQVPCHVNKMNASLRWKKRLQNLNKVFPRLRHACALPEYSDL